MKKIIALFLLLSILGSYIGFGSKDTVCNGPFRQNAIQLTITKPFVAGYWDMWLGFGNKHYDLITNTYDNKRWICDDDNTYKRLDLKEGEKYTTTCYWEKYTETIVSGCGWEYGKGYKYNNDFFINLTPWTKVVN